MRWGRTAAVAAVSAIGAGAAALLVGRVVSELSVRPRGVDPAGTGGLTVHATAAGQVALSRAPETERPGRWGLDWPGGHAVVGELLSTTPQTAVRRLERVDHGTLRIGSTVELTPRVLIGDPRTALGLEWSEATVRGELGPMPAWYVPGIREPWIIAVHGPGADREQVLPILPLMNELQVPVLAVTYRNDEGAPRSPDGIGHFGETEWRDVEAAIRLAVDSGARRIVLYGWSLGATMALQAAGQSAWTDAVRGVVLDSPVLDWKETARAMATRRGVPRPLAELGVRAAQGRAGVDPAVFDRLAQGDDLSVPALVLHSPQDGVAPVRPVRALAARKADRVILKEFPGAEHTALWNVDPEGYTDAVRRFLTPLF
jgi:pimeloyl-ACP methyl ester carboxylesterase